MVNSDHCPDVKQLCRLLGDLGHEVATPLASVLLTSEMLADNTQGNLSDRQVRSLHNLIQATSEVQRLMKRVVFLTRLATGEVEFEQQAFPLEALFEELAATHPELELEFSAPLPASALGDRLRLRELLELMIEFAQHRGGKAKLEVAAWPSGQLSVALQTPGPIPPEQREQALDPFGAGLKEARLGGGPGLELAVANKLAEGLGGRLELADGPDGSVVLTATLPAAAV